MAERSKSGSEKCGMREDIGNNDYLKNKLVVTDLSEEKPRTRWEFSVEERAKASQIMKEYWQKN